MTEYLIGPRDLVNALSGLSGKAAQAPHDPLPGGNRATDDEDSIVTANGAQNIRPGLAIQCRGNGLGATRHRAQDQHLAHPIDSEKQLGQEGIERSSAFLYAAVGYGVTCAFRSRNPSQPQLAQITGLSCLGDVPAPLEEEFAQILLAAHHTGVDDLEDGVVPFAFVGHGRSLARTRLIREFDIRIIDAT